MGKEIERKFLVQEGWRSAVDPETYVWIQQGYLSLDPERIVRLREVQLVAPKMFLEQGWLTVKGRNTGISRPEWEYEIPVKDLREMMALVTGAIVEKKRFRCGRWEIDEFGGANEGLVVAELELETQGEVVEHPEWLGKEVSEDKRYYNSNLVDHPYSGWPVWVKNG